MRLAVSSAIHSAFSQASFSVSAMMGRSEMLNRSWRPNRSATWMMELIRSATAARGSPQNA